MVIHSDDGGIMKLLDVPPYLLSWLVDKDRQPFKVGLLEKILLFIGCILIIVQIIFVAVKLLCQF